MPELDLSFLASAALREPLDSERTEHDLLRFVKEARATIAALRPAANAVANQVEVQPGGKVYPTISAALDAITDASQKKQYVCLIGPGTYAERVVCKSWVFLSGSGADQTVITAPASKDKTVYGTVVAAANSAIQDLAVTSTGNGLKSQAMAVVCNSVKNFDIENCEVTSRDDQGGAIALPVAVDFAPGQAGSVVYLAYTKAVVIAAQPETQALGVFAANYSFVQLTSCHVIVQTPGGWGTGASWQSTLTVDTSYVEGAEYSLKNIDLNATVTANQCTLVGPVGSDVTVNP